MIKPVESLLGLVTYFVEYYGEADLELSKFFITNELPSRL